MFGQIWQSTEYAVLTIRRGRTRNSLEYAVPRLSTPPTQVFYLRKEKAVESNVADNQIDWGSCKEMNQSTPYSWRPYQKQPGTPYRNRTYTASAETRVEENAADDHVKTSKSVDNIFRGKECNSVW